MNGGKSFFFGTQHLGSEKLSFLPALSAIVMLDSFVFVFRLTQAVGCLEAEHSVVEVKLEQQQKAAFLSCFIIHEVSVCLPHRKSKHPPGELRPNAARVDSVRSEPVC